MISFKNHKFGKFSEDEHITSLAEFKVQKISPRHHDPVVRTLCLSETCIIERDPATYIIVSCYPLSDVFAIIRDTESPQMFTVEFIRGATKKFMSTDRDSLLASLLDGVRASGNRDVCVKMNQLTEALDFAPVISTVDEEVESQHLRFSCSSSRNICRSSGEV
ncbi:DnaJ sub C member 13 [Desmophyllum pertusum]|uniref:DnaJ sub C member 13 n=1 Tax=Desmophyllum pertusum TaxID=174260 RepID=A0A9W9YMB9_9CNID|nr:DnaJ sub C member 13 [Desmophyllum pertusum]